MYYSYSTNSHWAPLRTWMPILAKPDEMGHDNNGRNCKWANPMCWSLALRRLQMGCKLRVFLIEYNVAFIGYKVVLLETLWEVSPQMPWDWAFALLRDSVVVLQDGLDGLCGFFQVVMRHLHQKTAPSQEVCHTSDSHPKLAPSCPGLTSRASYQKSMHSHSC